MERPQQPCSKEISEVTEEEARRVHILDGHACSKNAAESPFEKRMRAMTRQDKTRQDKTRQDKTRQDKTRQDKTRQDKTRQDKIYTTRI
jgi:hypothetical protein